MKWVLSALAVCLGLPGGLGLVAAIRGQEQPDARLRELAEASRKRVAEIHVSTTAGGRTTKAVVHPTPLMKYTDIPRTIEMATLWVWEDAGRPAVVGKVEAYKQPGATKWLYCFASTSTDLVECECPDGQRFRSNKAGIRWAALGGPAPQDKASGRLRQMKDLFRRFSATSRDDLLKTSDDLRSLPRPLYEYSSPEHGIVQGVLCGFTANGTNPDVIVALEATGEKGAPRAWRYGVLGMTASGIAVKLDGTEVYNRKYAEPPEESGVWAYFWEKPPPK